MSYLGTLGKLFHRLEELLPYILSGWTAYVIIIIRTLQIFKDLGNEFYLEPKTDEMIRFYEKEGNDVQICPVITMIGSFYCYNQNANVSIVDALQIIYNDKNLEITSEQEIHKLLQGVILPKISKKMVLPLIQAIHFIS